MAQEEADICLNRLQVKRKTKKRQNKRQKIKHYYLFFTSKKIEGTACESQPYFKRIITLKMEPLTDITLYNPQCQAKMEFSLIAPILLAVMMYGVHLNKIRSQKYEVPQILEDEGEGPKVCLKSSLDYTPLRQSIIYALAEFGPQTAIQILETISTEYSDLPLRGKSGVGLNSHLFSMKKDGILHASGSVPPVWSVIEA
jgi:hypothetical protein